jgi:hypothetical protein
MRRDSRRQLSSSDAARLRARAAVAAYAVLAPLRTSVRETQDAVGMLKTLSLLECLLVGFAGACCVVGVVLLLWLLSRVPGAPGGQAPAPTQQAPTPTQQAPTPTQQAPTPTQSTPTQQAGGPRWGVSVGAMTAVLLAVLVLIAGLAYFAFRRGRFYLLCFCVSLFGAEIIVLESYASIYPVPIFGQFVVLAGLLIAALLFLGRLAYARVKEYARNTQEEVLKQAETQKDEFIQKVIEKMNDKETIDDLKSRFNQLKPLIVQVLQEQFESIREPAIEAMKPLAQAGMGMVRDEAWKMATAPFRGALSTATAVGAAVSQRLGNASNPVETEEDIDEFHTAQESHQ